MSPSLVRFRRWATLKAYRFGLRTLARRLDPGPRIRLWDSEFALLADTDRGDVIPMETIKPGEHVTFEPALSVRVSGVFR